MLSSSTSVASVNDCQTEDDLFSPWKQEIINRFDKHESNARAVTERLVLQKLKVLNPDFNIIPLLARKPSENKKNDLKSPLEPEIGINPKSSQRHKNTRNRDQEVKKDQVEGVKVSNNLEQTQTVESQFSAKSPKQKQLSKYVKELKLNDAKEFAQLISLKRASQRVITNISDNQGEKFRCTKKSLIVPMRDINISSNLCFEPPFQSKNRPPQFSNFLEGQLFIGKHQQDTRLEDVKNSSSYKKGNFLIKSKIIHDSVDKGNYKRGKDLSFSQNVNQDPSSQPNPKLEKQQIKNGELRPASRCLDKEIPEKKYNFSINLARGENGRKTISINVPNNNLNSLNSEITDDIPEAFSVEIFQMCKKIEDEQKVQKEMEKKKQLKEHEKMTRQKAAEQRIQQMNSERKKNDLMKVYKRLNILNRFDEDRSNLAVIIKNNSRNSRKTPLFSDLKKEGDLFHSARISKKVDKNRFNEFNPMKTEENLTRKHN